MTGFPLVNSASDTVRHLEPAAPKRISVAAGVVGGTGVVSGVPPGGPVAGGSRNEAFASERISAKVSFGSYGLEQMTSSSETRVSPVAVSNPFERLFLTFTDVGSEREYTANSSIRSRIH